MAELSEIFSFLRQPSRQSGTMKRRPIYKFHPENSCYKNWGFAIYRTYYGAESDTPWKTLLEVLKQQTLLSVGYYENEHIWKRDWKWYMGPWKDKAKYVASLDTFKSLFRLLPKEDPLLLKDLDIKDLRDICQKEHPEAEERMAGASFCFVLVADKAVLDGIARNEFLVKALGYDWEGHIEDGGWGWVRLETGRLLELWEALLLSQLMDNSKYYSLGFEGPERDLETYLWNGDIFIPPLCDCSKAEMADPLTVSVRPWFTFNHQLR
ncbi:hypothetical protein CEK26_002013 [Fusarium fujikuroi]|nr:uncharacterized protein Y057_1057 [Fusarium fujikuroi]KLO96705.1 uncharacterized protein LW93_10085 [Fusarium fujikuroi]KLP02910.1 uncharacterized protein LW94_10653 [Fusarium fujikuroi]QGI69681.1 hypothetical protein CEK27_002010 [Fusarium fujikuroi]QGI87026.1 hypothetical protein CEK25_001982 [Fusarium fujikuroi]